MIVSRLTVEQYCPVTVTVESIIIVIYFTTQNSCRHRCCAVVVATAILYLSPALK